MINFVTFYYRYLFSKRMILVYGFIQIFFIFGLVYTSGLMDGYTYIDMYRTNYGELFFNDFLMITKFLSVIMVVFMSVMLANESCVNVEKYLVDKFVIKIKVIISKYVLSFMLVTVIVTQFFLYFAIINVFLTPYVLVVNTLKDVYIAILLQNYGYLCITFLLLKIIPSIFTSILPIGLYWYMEINQSLVQIEANTIIKIIYQVIPNPILIEEAYGLYSDIYLYGLADIVLVLMSVFIHINQEVK